MYRRDEFINVFPEKLKNKIKDYVSDGLQEVRVKINKPVILYGGVGEIILGERATKEDINYILKRISSYSLYAYEEEIKRGFITIKGGHRVGLAGECVMDGEKVKTIKNISSVNFRITREILGCSKKVIPYIVEDNEVLNTIIISPPKCGKTTILRDLSRVISNGSGEYKLNGKKVVIIDERSEIAAAYEGIPQMDVGIRTDILDNCQKSEGITMAVRSLSPEVIICDEIGRDKEVLEIVNAFNSGVKLVFSVHGKGIEDIYKREELNKLLKKGIVDRIIVLSNRDNKFLVDKIYKKQNQGDFKCLSIYG